MITQVLKRALAAIEAGESFALATVITAKGSSPGKPGHKMIVFADGRQEGTVGGGQLEHRVKQAAVEMIARGGGEVLTYSFDPTSADAIGMLCGGQAEIAVEVVAPRTRVLLCGGGHVAQALARQFGELGFVCGVADERPAVATAAAFPAAAEIVHESPDEYIARGGLERYSHVVVMTHDHARDRETLLAIAKIGFSGYTGLIGSRRKWDTIRKALEGAGIDEEWIAGVHCPVGLPIGAHTPAEIAVSITAEIIADLHGAQ